MNISYFLFPVACEDHSDSDCVAVGILTHGDFDIYSRVRDNKKSLTDTVLACDQPLRLEELTSIFRSSKCHHSLIGKPKLFFIQVTTFKMHYSYSYQ